VSRRILCVCVASGKSAELKLLAKSKVDLSGVVCLADAGYQGIAKVFPRARTPKRKPPSRNGIVRRLTKAQKKANRALRKERVVVEHSFRLLKVFAILSCVYRNRRKRFSLRWHLLAALYNRELDRKENQKLTTK
jgi:IS5 family transposase